MITGNLKAAFDLLPAPGTLMAVMNDMPAFVIKMDREMALDAPAIRGGSITAALQPQLGLYAAGAVLRMAVEVTLSNMVGYTFDAFANPAAADDAPLLAAWTSAPTYAVAFHTAAGDTVAVKAMRLRPATQREIAGLLDQARQHNATCAHLDFVQAKSEMMRDTQ